MCFSVYWNQFILCILTKPIISYKLKLKNWIYLELNQIKYIFNKLLYKLCKKIYYKLEGSFKQNWNSGGVFVVFNRNRIFKKVIISINIFGIINPSSEVHR